ncbi:tellurite resistance protein TehB [Saccharicrinis fermentans DSM 9555 = JCM 21142]|uniref:Tellurite resistance protein TehB n=2 Tax=Saccharicrinis fermentans TaxID=982 RepID=W7YAW7_9BACT|nr:tellurite resistance protein TehB [Saccharicrinis fermentans DSM 9555 = JCM 21142]
MWDKRYSSESYVYGTAPNCFFAEELENLKEGKLLLPAEGEGRNAVYAAKKGWDVVAFDQSKVAKGKADKLAERQAVQIDYRVAEFNEIFFEPASFDAIALVYAHFPSHKMSSYHRQLDKYLKIGGIIILEGFSKSHPEVSKNNERPMGPPDRSMLYSIGDIERDFDNYEMITLREEQLCLNEGAFHVGQGAVIRFVGKKLS